MRSVFQNASVIEVVDHRVFFASLDGSGFVCFVHTCHALLFVYFMAEGLTGSGDTAVRAGHDFYKVKMHFFFLNPFNEVLGVSKAAHHAHMDLTAVQVQRGFFDAVHAAYAGELDVS